MTDKYKQKQDKWEKVQHCNVLSFQLCTVTKPSIMLSPYFLNSRQIRIAVCSRIRRILAWNHTDSYENAKHILNIARLGLGLKQRRTETRRYSKFSLTKLKILKKMVLFPQIIVHKRETLKLFLTLDALLPIRRVVVCTHPGVWQENKQILQNTMTTKLISAWCSKVTYFWINSTSYGRTNSHPMATFIRDICKTN